MRADPTGHSVRVVDNDEPKLAYSTRQAADLISVSRPYIYKLIERGQLRSVTLGGRRLIPRSALLEMLGDRIPDEPV